MTKQKYIFSIPLWCFSEATRSTTNKRFPL